MAENQLSVQDDLRKMESQFKAALPAHVSREKFLRVVLTAVNADPDLANADRRSLLESAMRCAQDGLLPDKREAAFVVFNNNVAKKGQPAQWIKKVQYMPMVAGIIKRIHQTGELKSINSAVVYENDDFDYELGDSERIVHKPEIRGDRGPRIGAYAIIQAGEGVYREFMTAAEIEDVKAVSKALSGPWFGPFEPEMWRKTVIRRLSKRIPMSTEMHQLFERDDDLYELKGRDVTPVAEAPKMIDLPRKLSNGQRSAIFVAASNKGMDEGDILALVLTHGFKTLSDVTIDKMDEILKMIAAWKKPEPENPQDESKAPEAT